MFEVFVPTVAGTGVSLRASRRLRRHGTEGLEIALDAASSGAMAAVSEVVRDDTGDPPCDGVLSWWSEADTLDQSGGTEFVSRLSGSPGDVVIGVNVSLEFAGHEGLPQFAEAYGILHLSECYDGPPDILEEAVIITEQELVDPGSQRPQPPEPDVDPYT